MLLNYTITQKNLPDITGQYEVPKFLRKSVNSGVIIISAIKALEGVDNRMAKVTVGEPR